MKALRHIQIIILLVVIGMVFSVGVFGQNEDDKVPGQNPGIPENGSKSSIAKNNKANKTDGDVKIVSTDDGDDKETKEAKKTAEYYNNYLTEYRLGPQDIISIDVFRQCPDYCKTDVVVPPTARVSYPLIREGVFVGGKTVRQVEDDVTKKLEEYIINPTVSVTLVRAGSARYSVMGKVMQPGVRIMDRRVSINDAILESGGIAKGGSRKKVFIVNYSPEGLIERKAVDLVAIEKGKIPTIFLKPGDQVFVGEKGFTITKLLGIIEKLAPARVLFGSPF